MGFDMAALSAMMGQGNTKVCCSSNVVVNIVMHKLSLIVRKCFESINFFILYFFLLGT
jgi:hypothetical protein